MRTLVGLLLLMFPGAILADELTRAVQEQLQTQGAYSGPVDGERSAEFVNALKAYQQRHNLPASGVIDRATAKALDDDSGLALPEATTAGAAGSTPAAASSPTGGPRLPLQEPVSAATRTPAPETPSPSAHEISPPIVTPTVSVTPAPEIPQPSPIESRAPPLIPSPTASPMESPAPPPPQFSTERVTAFLRAYLHAGEGKYVTPQLRFFSFPVDYFTNGPVKEQFVRSDTLRYMRRWPRRRYLLVEPVKVMPVDNEAATADFTMVFTVQRGKRRTNGRTSNRVTLREMKGELKIVAIKEQRVAD